jgi:Icc protein
VVLRIGLLTDIHYGADTEYQKGRYAPALLREFVGAMEEFQPHLVVELGDRMNNLSPEDDGHHLLQLTAVLQDLPCSVQYVLGNHDLVYLGKERSAELLGQAMNDLQIAVYHGFPMLFVNSEGPKPHLHLDLMAGTERTAFVFSHRPLLPVSLENNRLFPKGTVQHCPWGEGLIQELRETGWNPICIHGHLHWNYCLVQDSIIQVCIPSLVDIWEVEEPAGSFGKLVIQNGAVHLDIAGRLPAHYTFQVKEGEYEIRG